MTGGGAVQSESRKMDTERWTDLAHSWVLALLKKNGPREESNFRKGRLWGDYLVSTLSALQLELGSGLRGEAFLAFVS